MKLNLPVILLALTIAGAVQGQSGLDKLADLVPDHVAEEWKEQHGVKPSVQLNIQKVQDEVILPDGTPILIDKLEPMAIYSANAECQVDGKTVACPSPSVSTTVTNGQKVVVSKSSDGKIKSIKARSLTTGKIQSLQAVSESALTFIPEGATDEEYSKKFIMQSAPIPGTEGPGRNLRRTIEAVDHTNTPRRNLQGACSEYRVVETAIAAESSFCSDLGGQAAAFAKIESVMADVAVEYEQNDLCFTVEISYSEVFCDPSIDPYKAGVDLNESGCGDDGLLQYFQDYWNDNRQGVSRDVAELFSGTGLECFDNGACVIGCAYVGATCQFSASAYGVNYVTYTGNTVGQSNLVAHEMGHTIGAGHDNRSEDYIMFPSNDDVNRIFGPQSVAAFLGVRNNACITAPPATTTTTTTTTSTTTTPTTTTTTTTPTTTTTTTTPATTTTTTPATTTTTTTPATTTTTTPATTTTTTTVPTTTTTTPATTTTTTTPATTTTTTPATMTTTTPATTTTTTPLTTTTTTPPATTTTTTTAATTTTPVTTTAATTTTPVTTTAATTTTTAATPTCSKSLCKAHRKKKLCKNDPCCKWKRSRRKCKLR